jgi:hypothetical protein
MGLPGRTCGGLVHHGTGVGYDPLVKGFFAFHKKWLVGLGLIYSG